jgi:hypothetical protein
MNSDVKFPFQYIYRPICEADHRPWPGRKVQLRQMEVREAGALSEEIGML